MHANELIRRIVGQIHHHTEGERQEMLAAVDEAFPVHVVEPAPRQPTAFVIDESQFQGPVDEDQTPGLTTPDRGTTPATPSMFVEPKAEV